MGRRFYRRRLLLLRRVADRRPTSSLLRVRRIPDLWWNVLGYGMWAVGCLMFALAAARDGDVVTTVAGVLFLVGVLVVIGPMIRASKRH